MFQYVFSGESEWTEQRIKQLQVLKDIALKVTDFINQFEDELVKIWNKPKFVLNSNYVITLDRIIGMDLAREYVAAHNLSDSDATQCEWASRGCLTLGSRGVI